MKKQLNKQYIEIPAQLKRVSYFNGQLLTQSDLTAEQTYTIKRSRLHNLYIHGYGVVSGLEVSVSKDHTDTLTVSPGVAIDSFGNEIIIPAPVKVPFPKKGETAFIVLYWAERETDFVPAFGGTGAGEGMTATRMEEYAILKIEAEDTVAKPGGIPLARLKKIRGAWKVDKKFHAHHVKK